jgi:hypothetical protein
MVDEKVQITGLPEAQAALQNFLTFVTGSVAQLSSLAGESGAPTVNAAFSNETNGIFGLIGTPGGGTAGAADILSLSTTAKAANSSLFSLTNQATDAASFLAALRSAPDLGAAFAEGAAIQSQVNATLLLAKANSEAFVASQVEGATANNQLAIAVNAAKAGSEEFLASQGEAAVSAQQLAEANRVAVDRALINQNLANFSAVPISSSVNPSLPEDVASKALIAAQTELVAIYGNSAEGQQRLAALANESFDVETRLTVARQLLSQASTEQANLLREQVGLPTAATGGVAGSRGRFGFAATGVQALLGGDFSTALNIGAGFIGAQAFFSVFAQIQQAVTESLNFERELTVTKQLLIDTDQAGQFNTVKASLLDISSKANVAASSLVAVFNSAQSAFGGAQAGLAATQQATELSKIAGATGSAVTPTAALQDLIVVGKNFGITADNLSQINDRLVGTFQRYGTPVGETVAAVKELANAGETAGLNFNFLIEALAKSAQLEGLAPTQEGERLARVFDAFTQNSSKLLQAAQSSGVALTVQEVQGGLQSTIDALAKANLTDDQIAKISAAFGGSRALPALVPFLESIKTAEVGSTIDDAGKAQKQFNDLLHSASEELGRIFTTLKDIVATIASSGFLGDIEKVLEPLATVLKDVIDLNNYLGGLPVKIFEIISAIKLLQVALESGVISRLLGGGAVAAEGFSNPLLGQVAAGSFGGGPTAALAETGGGIFGGALAGAGATVGAFALPAAIAIGSIVAVTKSFSDERSKLDAAANAYAASLTHANTQVVNNLSNKPNSFASDVFSVFGVPTPQDVARNQQANNAFLQAHNTSFDQVLQNVQSVQAGLQAGVVTVPPSLISALQGSVSGRIINDLKTGAKGISDLISLVNKGNGDALAVAFDLYQAITAGNPATANQLQTALQQIQATDPTAQLAVTAQQEQNAVQHINDVFHENFANAADVVAAYKSGEVPLGAALEALNNEANNLKIINPSQSLKDLKEAVSLRAQAAVELSDTLSKGNQETPQEEVDRLTKLVQNPAVQADPQTEVAQAKRLQEAEQKLADDQLKHATSLAQIQNIQQNGIQNSGTIAAAAALFENELKNEDTAWSTFITDYAINDDQLNRAAQLAVQTQESIVTALTTVIRQDIQKDSDNLSQLLRSGNFTSDQISQITDDLNRLDVQLEGLAAPQGSTGGPPTEPGRPSTAAFPSAGAGSTDQAAAERKNRADALALAKSQIDLAKAQAHDDPVAAAQAQLQAAEQDLLFAEQEQVDDTISANKKQADINNARAAVIRAQDAAIKAQDDLTQAKFTLQEAQDKLQGNDLQAAKDALSAANAQVASDLKNRPQDQTALAKDRATAADAARNVFEQQLKDKEDTIQFNLDMGFITKQTAAAQYEAILSSADNLKLTKQEREDLQRKIHDLTTSGDLQFDLPSDIGIPTLYQARRLSQLGPGQTYTGGQAPNIINLAVYTTNTLDKQGFKSIITGAVANGPAVFGAQPRIY